MSAWGIKCHIQSIILFLVRVVTYISSIFCLINIQSTVHSSFSNASFQIKDNKRKMGPALPILQNLDCVDQIWIKINHPSLVSSNIFVPLVKIGFFVRQYHSCTFSFKLVLYHSSSFIQDSKYPNTFHYIEYCALLFSRFQ